MKKNKSCCPRSGLILPACLFIGIGVGMVFGHTGAGTLIGLGVGFLGMWVFRSK